MLRSLRNSFGVNPESAESDEVDWDELREERDQS